MDLFSTLYHLEFCSFASGSSGNCYYLGHHDGVLLIDAGISLKRIEKAFKEIGRDPKHIQGVLISHNHIDHIAGLGALAEKYSCKIYATAEVISALSALDACRDHMKATFVEIKPGKPFVVAGFGITAFEVDHDVPGTVGFHIRNSQRRIALATDLGNIGPHAAAFLSNTDVLVLEANYDEHLLQSGPYPPYLQHRISSPSGHLSNNQAAAFVAQHCGTHLRHLFLAHLSKENNHPLKAIETFHMTFKLHNFDPARLETFVCLEPAVRSKFYTF